MNLTMLPGVLCAAVLLFSCASSCAQSGPVGLDPGDQVAMPDHGRVWVQQDPSSISLTQLKYTTVRLNAHRGSNFGRSLVWPVATKAKQTIELPGVAAMQRIASPLPIFYVRDSAAESDEAASPTSAGFRLVVVHLKANKSVRVVETISSTQITGHLSRSDDTSGIVLVAEPVPHTRWTRIWFAKPLEPGEYALTWLPDQPDVFSAEAYDFGIDPAAPAGK